MTAQFIQHRRQSYRAHCLSNSKYRPLSPFYTDLTRLGGQVQIGSLGRPAHAARNHPRWARHSAGPVYHVCNDSSEASHMTLLSSYRIPSIAVLGHGSHGLKTVLLPVGRPTPFEVNSKVATPYPFRSITLVQFGTEFPLLPFDSFRSSRSGQSSH
jgi:hypothetical protein